MRILLTGASGFLGNVVVDKLLEKGMDIVYFGRKTNEQLNEKGIKFIKGDLNDKNSLANSLKDIDVVIHLAAATDAIDEKTNYEVNVIGTENLVNACKKNKIKKIIFTSSVNAILKKNSYYGKSKKLAEKPIIESGLDYVIFRPELIYGKGDQKVMKTIEIIKSFPVIPILGNGKSKMQPIFAEDIAELITLAAIRPIKNKIYFAGGSEAFSFNQYLDKICKEINIKKMKFHIPYFFVLILVKIMSKITANPPVRLEQLYGMNQNKNFNISKLEKDFEFKLTKFEKGLKETLK